MDTPDLETVKTISTMAAPFTKAIIDVWLKPKLTKFLKTQKTDKQLLEYSVAEKFDEYLQRTYEKHTYLTTIVFQNQKKRLVDLYLPLTVKSAKDSREIVIDSYRPEFLPDEKKVLLTDTAGMGKSTILKLMFLSCIERNKGLPVFVELRKLRHDKRILDVIYSELNALGEDFDKDFVLRLINRGDFVFFLDGYDEIPFDERQAVTQDLQNFVSKARNNLFMVTSRPETSLASFPDFQRFSVEPLKKDEAFGLIGKYGQGGSLSEELIKKLKRPELKPIEEFLTNPLLVSLLYKSYEYKSTIPFKKHIFYRQVYDSLFESHDLTKEGGFERRKHSQLDIEDFHRVLRSLGILTVKLGQIEFEKDRLISLLREARSQCPSLEFKEADFLRDLLSTVPLFLCEGDHYRWAHKSIQEYFAAQFICFDAKGNQAPMLRAISTSKNNAKYANLLDLCYDIDYKTFRRSIIYDLITQFLAYCSTSYLRVDRTKIRESEIQLRKAFTFSHLHGLLPSKTAQAFIRRESPDDLWVQIQRRLSEAGHAGESLRVVAFGHPRDAALLVADLPHSPVVELLIKKRDPIFTRTPVRSMLRSARSARTAVRRAVRLDVKDTVLVSDDPDSFLNRAETFSKVNAILSTRSVHALDLKRCIGVKSDVEAEIAKEQGDNPLLGNF